MNGGRSNLDSFCVFVKEVHVGEQTEKERERERAMSRDDIDRLHSLFIIYYMYI